MMKYLLLSVSVVLILSACGGEKDSAATKLEAQVVSHDSHNSDEMGRLIYYTCPMASHKHIHSSEPGSCPECGMALVPASITTPEKAEFYGCPMEIHSHVRQDGPGTCGECGMELKPMRLKKSA
jgi:hypothetical protein